VKESEGCIQIFKVRNSLNPNSLFRNESKFTNNGNVMPIQIKKFEMELREDSSKSTVDIGDKSPFVPKWNIEEASIQGNTSYFICSHSESAIDDKSCISSRNQLKDKNKRTTW
jgi:hypothetical protein